MGLDAIEEKVVAALSGVSHNLDEKGLRDSNTAWTVEIKRQLGRLGNDLGFLVCASVPPGSRGPGSWYGEYLYDLTWLHNDPDGPNGGWLLDCPLALESEWHKSSAAIVDDFDKLVLARASRRVMVFQADRLDLVREVIQHLVDRISHFRGRHRGDRYLFCGLRLDTGAAPYEFVFDLHVVADQGEHGVG